MNAVVKRPVRSIHRFLAIVGFTAGLGFVACSRDAPPASAPRHTEEENGMRGPARVERTMPGAAIPTSQPTAAIDRMQQPNEPAAEAPAPSAPSDPRQAGALRGYDDQAPTGGGAAGAGVHAHRGGGGRDQGEFGGMVAANAPAGAPGTLAAQQPPPPPPPAMAAPRPATGSGGAAGAALARSWADTPPANSAVAIDANGRFATTYRPGAGYLAAFEAALTGGRIPTSARELVGDLGARYAPSIDPPATGALAFRVDMERSALPPSGGPLRVRLALRSTVNAATARPTMSVHLVLDTSGSMSGRSMDDAKLAARALVDRLQPGDTFSLTRFSSDVEVLVPTGPVGPRREHIRALIETIRADGGTNIAAGLESGYAQCAHGPQTPDTVKLVMLVSDGRATEGETDSTRLAGLAGSAFQNAVQTSAFGVGTDYDGPLMASIADQGAGGYYYVRDSARIGSSLTTELDSRVQPVAQAVEIRVRLRSDVQLIQTYGSRRLNETESAQVRAQEVAVDNQVAQRDRIVRNRQNDLEGGMRFFIPGFARDDRHVILLGLRLPEGAGDRPLATVELRYKDRLLGRNVTQEIPLRIRFADSDAASLATLDPSVARTIQGFDAGETLVTAARAIEHMNRPQAAALLTEREEILRGSATRLNDPRLGEDATRVARFRDLVQGSTELSEPMVLALLMDTSARGYMH